MSKKKQTDLFGDDDFIASKSISEFGKLLEGQTVSEVKLKAGDKFKGTILTIGKQEAFVSTGTAIDGALPIADLLDKEKEVKFKVGEVIEVRVVRVGDAEVLLKRVGASTSSAGVEDLQDAYELELPIEGKVHELTKGGFRVEIMGQMAFCPISQMDFRVDVPENYLSQRFDFLITKFEGSRNIVVSRRRLLDAQRAEAESDFVVHHKKGDIFQGKISRIEKFGAFVEVDNFVQGLIPISELAWHRVQSPQDVVTLGQNVQVMLLAFSEEDGRLKISFSLKQGGGESDPWLKVINDFPVGKLFEGVVERKEPYGLFINLMPGVTGLLPKSKWQGETEFQSFDTKKKGDRVLVQVDEIRFEEKRISLSPPREKDDLSWKAHAGSKSKSGFGTLGDLLKKKGT